MCTKASLYRIQILFAQLRLFYFFLFREAYTFLFMCQCVDSVDLDIVHHNNYSPYSSFSI